MCCLWWGRAKVYSLLLQLLSIRNNIISKTDARREGDEEGEKVCVEESRRKEKSSTTMSVYICM